MEKIRFEHVGVTYTCGSKPQRILQDVSLSIGEGQFVCLIGHSGCGKTTLLHAVCGLVRPQTGRILIDGQEIFGPGLDRSIVMQQYSLFPWLTAGKNVAFGIRQARPELSRRQLQEHAASALAQVELGDAVDKYPFQLSGGMQQRVAIARAFAMDSDIMLLDEPFGALDPRIRHKLQALLEVRWKQEEQKKTILFVTHDIEEAITLADRILFMKPGRILADLPVPFERPRNHRDLMQRPECCDMRKQLIELFYLSQEYQEKGEEAVI